MDIGMSNAILAAATQASQQQVAGAAQASVLKKSLDAQASTALGLLQSVTPPQSPSTALATSGSVGTRLNTWA